MNIESTLECLIIEDLKEAYRLNRDTDQELLNALDKVLEYYMNPHEYTLWRHYNVQG